MTRTDRAFAPWTERERQRLRLLRLELGLSFDALASQIGGLSPGTVRGIIETGRQPIQTNVFKVRRWMDAVRDLQQVGGR